MAGIKSSSLKMDPLRVWGNPEATQLSAVPGSGARGIKGAVKGFTGAMLSPFSIQDAPNPYTEENPELTGDESKTEAIGENASFVPYPAEHLAILGALGAKTIRQLLAGNAPHLEALLEHLHKIKGLKPKITEHITTPGRGRWDPDQNEGISVFPDIHPEAGWVVSKPAKVKGKDVTVDVRFSHEGKIKSANNPHYLALEEMQKELDEVADKMPSELKTMVGHNKVLDKMIQDKLSSPEFKAKIKK